MSPEDQTSSSILIVGYGTVGQNILNSIIQFSSVSHEIFIYDRDSLLVNKLNELRDLFFSKLSDVFEKKKRIDYCHVTIPQGLTPPEYDEYRRLIIKILFKVKCVIIHSSISPDMIDDLQSYFEKNKHLQNSNHILYYSPIRATERCMSEHLMMTRMYLAKVSFVEDRIHQKILTYIKSIGFAVQEFKSAQSLALGKLVSVAWFGFNIAFVQQLKLMCDDKGVRYDFEEVYTEFARDSYIAQEYTKEYSENPQLVDTKWIKRPIFYPGEMGGKCIVPDAQLMWMFYPNKISEFIINSNQHFRQYMESVKKAEDEVQKREN